MGIDLRQQRLAVLFILGTLLISAALVASGTTRLVANVLLPLEASLPAANSAAARPSAPTLETPSEEKDPTAILHRNIFDSQGGPLDVEAPPPSDAVPPPDPNGGGPEVVVDPNRPPPRCEGAVRLVGSFYVPRSPQRSFAAITNTAGKVLLYREGMNVDDKTVYTVGPDMVDLRASSGSLCRLTMFAPPEVAGATPPPAAPAAEAPAAPSGEGDGALSAAEMDQGIQRVSDTEYNVTRSLVTRVLENQSQLLTSARVVPQEEGGRTTGMKIYGIRRNGLLGRLGIQNGDVLRTINGYNLTSPDSALEAYTRLRSADHLTIQMMRRGTPVNVNFSIR